MEGNITVQNLKKNREELLYDYSWQSTVRINTSRKGSWLTLYKKVRNVSQSEWMFYNLSDYRGLLSSESGVQ